MFKSECGRSSPWRRVDGGGGGRGWGGLCEVGAVEPRVEVRVLVYRDDSGGELR
jgi:hypothetical protein